MRNFKAALAATLFLATSAGPSLAATDEIESRTRASKAVIKEFSGDLKGELVAALEAGGPVSAISMCTAKAPDIAETHSMATGWRVGRTSLKVRNPANAPDEWEARVLMDFEVRKANGEDPAMIDFAQIVEAAGKKEFRYMKAIPTAEKPCLACHGANLDPEVAAEIDALYPTDEARGYSAGDLRGAFTIRQPM